MLGAGEGLGQQAARTGNRAEAGRRSGRGGQDPGPTRAQPYQSSGEQHSISKNIYSESKLMRYCISADNRRMWGWALQEGRSTQSTQSLHRATRAWGRPALHGCRRQASLHPEIRAHTGDSGTPSTLPGDTLPRVGKTP